MGKRFKMAVTAVILAAFTHFHPSLAFTWPAHAVDLGSGGFWLGFASGLTIGIYDYLGYNTTAYLGAEVRDPGRVLPRSIIYAIGAVMGIYLLLQIGVLGVVHWQDMLDSKNIASQSVASAVLQDTWGKGSADVVTVLILITAFASVFTGLLGGSRVPFDAARDGVFFKSFGRLHGSTTSRFSASSPWASSPRPDSCSRGTSAARPRTRRWPS